MRESGHTDLIGESWRMPLRVTACFALRAKPLRVLVLRTTPDLRKVREGRTPCAER